MNNYRVFALGLFLYLTKTESKSGDSEPCSMFSFDPSRHENLLSKNVGQSSSWSPLYFEQFSHSLQTSTMHGWIYKLFPLMTEIAGAGEILGS